MIDQVESRNTGNLVSMRCMLTFSRFCVLYNKQLILQMMSDMQYLCRYFKFKAILCCVLSQDKPFFWYKTKHNEES